MTNPSEETRQVKSEEREKEQLVYQTTRPGSGEKHERNREVDFAFDILPPTDIMECVSSTSYLQIPPTMTSTPILQQRVYREGSLVRSESV